MTKAEINFAIAADIARSLRGSRIEEAWRAPCPFKDRHALRKGCGDPSMWIHVGPDGIEISCSEGCEPDALRRWLTTYGFLPRAGGSIRHKGDEEALAIWRDGTKPIFGTHGAAFLSAQGVDPRAIPGTIRFRRPGRTRLPMVAALVQSPARHPIALHLLLLDQDEPRLVDLPIPQRITIGALGLGAIRLCPPSSEVEVVDDLIEGLRALQAGRRLWVSLGAWRRHRVEIPQNLQTKEAA